MAAEIGRGVQGSCTRLSEKAGWIHLDVDQSANGRHFIMMLMMISFYYSAQISKGISDKVFMILPALFFSLLHTCVDRERYLEGPLLYCLMSEENSRVFNVCIVVPFYYFYRKKGRL